MHASLSLTLLLPALVLAGQDHASQDQVAPPSNEKLAALHATACASCHQPPDTRFAVDRAWITQLADTA